MKSNSRSGKSARSWKSGVACLLIALWILGWLLMLLYDAFDWEGSRKDKINGTSPRSIKEVPYFQLKSYQAASVGEYRQSIRGLQYDRGGGVGVGAEAEAKVSDPAIFFLRDLLTSWNPDDTREEMWETSPAHPNQSQPKHRRGVVRRFDFLSPADMKVARQYRENEVPFIVYNIPELDAAVSKLSVENLLNNFGSVPRAVERSENNHFMYYSAKLSARAALAYSDWRAPQTDLPLTFSKFLRHAEEAEDQEKAVGSLPLHYLTISAQEGISTPWVRQAFPFFHPHREDNFFVVDNRDFKGINCRFGMRGIVQEAHFDSRRNFIAMVRGRKRYILLPPSECDKLSLLPHGHPSARHSDVDWSDPVAVEKAGKLGDAKATEAIIASGEMLYVPAFWFHYIVSQDATIQCNARSGSCDVGKDVIDKCMSERTPARPKRDRMQLLKKGLLLEALANH